MKEITNDDSEKLLLLANTKIRIQVG